jgi:mRNA-degrading endonuclease toxin of MazEF toxin-antitoxin module
MPFPVHIRLQDFSFDKYPQWGDIYWYDFGIPRAQQHTMAEPHLAIIVSNTGVTLRGTVLIVPLSGAEHRKDGYDFHVLIKQTECPQLDKDSVAKVDQIYCVPTNRLPDQYYLTHLEKRIMARLYEPLLVVLGVPFLVGRQQSVH